MKFLEIFRFEIAYQLRRSWPWLSFIVMIVFAFFSTRIAIVPVTLPQDFILNSPFIITAVSVFSCQIWLLLSPVIAGDAAARDLQTLMHPLMYTSPVTKSYYLGGRFLAAFALHALILIGVQIGSLLAVYGPGANPEIIGPFRPMAYITAYCFIALTNAIIATTFQFSIALFTGRPMASYFGSLILFFLSYPVTFALYFGGFGNRALLADPIGVMAIMNEMMSKWTIVEKNVRMFTLEGAMLWNRLLWLGIALGSIALMYLRFRMAHRISNGLWSRLMRKLPRREISTADIELSAQTQVYLPSIHQSSSFRLHLQQIIATALSSFKTIAASPGGLFLLIAFPMLLTFVVLVEMQHWGISLLPRTPHLLMRHLTGLLTAPNNYWIMVPLFTIYFSGDLIWRERDVRMSECVDATPVPGWVLFLGKFIGLALVLATLMTITGVVGLIVQVIKDYHDFQIVRYVQVLLGLQLTDYLLFAALAFIVQVVVNQKYVAHLVALTLYMLIIFSSFLGIEHDLLVYASGPKWLFTDMRGLESIVPWLWLRLYWAAWALLLSIVARLLWIRGKEVRFNTRIRIAVQNFNRPVKVATGISIVLIIGLGSYIFYNTNVLNEYITDEEHVERRAQYERLYGRYQGITQPERSATDLKIDIDPIRKVATINGTYRLVNKSNFPIDSIHVEPAFYVTTSIRFDRPLKLLIGDEKLGHYIYRLNKPLQPGDSLILSFDVKFEPQGFNSSRGFRNTGAGIGIFDNGTYFTGGALPVIGYQPLRELSDAEGRRKHGLPRQVTLPAPGDIDPGVASSSPATFKAIISTTSDQVAVAPGELRRTWNESGRSYFQYVSDVPINGQYIFFSAKYKVHQERWNNIDLQLFIHPTHAEHLERLLRSVRASLDYYSSQFGTYPYRFLQIIEQPGNFIGMGVDGSGVITGGEGFFLLDPKGEGFDAMFEIVAHEMGHQWWGVQLKPAFAEGGGVISEGLAWYSAMQLVKNEKSREALRRFMSFMREPNPWPPIRTGLPLLRAMDPWANYRKAPYAMHAISEYVGEARINNALNKLIKKKKFSLATTIDLYNELQAVTPDSLKNLLHDLFEVNAFWTFNTKQAKAEQKDKDNWQVTFDIEAHKVVADSAGVETEVPVDQWVEVGVFAPAKPGEILGKPLYVQKHFIHSGEQSITVTVPQKPARGGIDPYNLLDWEEGDNIEKILVEDIK
ncbi:ABC transporter permease/M1 family aminopeptidase [Chryseosolibacter indicus]|uniref:ABC transporter permease subunit n=1 Tax=Chryseosolibacter indicus TaxID=2782351 RepID=A0ABS5VXY5_9BACT|nr:M1 family aminopeptidase [Chryseosolibacter indicus]MBT1705712.1 ABC transporter permease subunit [Chryseosolibacter indicus]